jgi:hypothetical protein
LGLREGRLVQQGRQTGLERGQTVVGGGLAGGSGAVESKGGAPPEQTTSLHLVSRRNFLISSNIAVKQFQEFSGLRWLLKLLFRSWAPWISA